MVQRQGFSALVLYGPDTLLNELSHLKLGFLEQDDQQRRVHFPFLPPHEQWRGSRARAANKGGAGRAAGAGARLSGRRRRRCARARIP